MKKILVLWFIGWGVALGSAQWVSSQERLVNGVLPICPAKPNCVSSELSADEDHRIEALSFENLEKAHKDLLVIVRGMDGARVQVIEPLYLHFVFTSKIFRFKDDVEFRFDPINKKIQVRSASRLGYSDLGVNRKRVEKIRQWYVAAQKIL